MNVSLILLVFSHLFFACHTIELTVEVDPNWNRENIIVGYKDKISFRLTDLSRCDWRTNVGHDESKNASIYPVSGKIPVEEDMKIICSFTDPHARSIEIQIISKDQREVMSSITEIRVNQGEMLTITDITECDNYSFNGISSTISSSLFHPMYLVEGNIRIISVSMNHVGIHSCTRLYIRLIGLKEIITQKFTNELDISIVAELQSLILETDNLKLSDTWKVFLVDESGEAVTTDHTRFLKGNKLMIDTMTIRKNLTIIYSDSENSISGNVRLMSVTPIFTIYAFREMIIDNLSYDVTCHIEDLSSFAITHSELIITRFNYFLSSSKASTLITSLKTRCNRGYCIFSCIHKFEFQNKILVFETEKSYEFLSLVNVSSDLVFTVQYGWHIALTSKDDSPSTQKIFCDDSGSILDDDSEFEDVYVVQLTARKPIFKVYSSLNNDECSTPKDGDPHATLKVSPLIAEFSEYDGTASLSISSVNEVFDVILIFRTSPHSTLRVKFCGQTNDVPLDGLHELFTNEMPGTLGIFDYEVVEELTDENMESTETIQFYHQIEVVPYLKFEIASTPIIVVQNEHVSLCPAFVSSDIFCDLINTSSSLSIPFHDLKMVSHSKCWYFQVTLREPFTLQCRTKNYFEQIFFQHFTVKSFPYIIIHKILIIDVDDRIQIHGKSFKIVDDTDVILERVFIYPKKFPANQKYTVSDSFYQTLSSGLYHGEVITKVLFKLEEMGSPRLLYLTHVAHITRKTIVWFINEVGLILSCTASEASESSIWWTHGSLEEMNFTGTPQNSHEIPAPLNAGSMTFSCNWMNSTHFGKDIFDVESREFPFTAHIQASSSFLLKGDQFTVNCVVKFASSSPYPGYVKIARDDDASFCSSSNAETCQTSQTNYSVGRREDVTSSINVLVTSAGTYKFKCIVFHQVLSREYQLEVLAGEQISLTLEFTPSQSVLLGSDVSLRCNVNRPVSESSGLELYNPNNQKIYYCSGTELVHNLKTVTAANSGQYRCIMVFKSVDRQIFAVNTLTIRTEDLKPELEFEIMPKTKIKPDQQFKLTCRVSNTASADSGTLQITNGNANCKQHNRCTEINYSSNHDTAILNVSNADKLHDVNYTCFKATSLSTTAISIPISWFIDPYVEILLENSNSWRIDSSCIIKCCLMGDFSTTTEFNWEIQVPSQTNLSQTKSKNCAIVEISSLSWDHYGQLSCLIQIDQISVSKNYQIVPIGVKVDVNVPMVPQNSKLAVGSTLNLNCKVINTEKVQIFWNVNLIILEDCSKVVDNSNSYISTTTCKIKLTDMGLNSIKCIYSMSQTSKNEELISYQVDVVTGPSILKFDRKKSELNSTNPSMSLICIASGFVTQILIFSVESDSSKNMKLAEKNISKEVNAETFELFYEIPDANANKKKIYECRVISRSSITFAESIQVTKQLTFDPTSNLYILILSMCIPIFAVLIGIAILRYWMKNRRKMQESNVLF